MLDIIVNNSMISGLEGKVGSNPRVVRIYPEDIEFTQDELITKSLPEGCKPGDLIVDEIKGRKIFVIVFEIEKATDRNDLASLSFLLEKDVVEKDFEILTSELIDFLKKRDLLYINYLEEQLPAILSGFNETKKIKFKNLETNEDYEFDVPTIIKKKKLQLKTKARKTRGGFL